MADKTLESLVGGSAFPINYPIRLNMIEPIVEHNGATFLRNGVFETDVENYPDAYVSNMLVVSEQKKIFDFSGPASNYEFTNIATDGTYYLARYTSNGAIYTYDSNGVYVNTTAANGTFGLAYDSINDSFWAGYTNGGVREYELVNEQLVYTGRYVYLSGTYISDKTIIILQFDPNTATMFVKSTGNYRTTFNTISMTQTSDRTYANTVSGFYIDKGLIYFLPGSPSISPSSILEGENGQITEKPTYVKSVGLSKTTLMNTPLRYAIREL